MSICKRNRSALSKFAINQNELRTVSSVTSHNGGLVEFINNAILWTKRDIISIQCIDLSTPNGGDSKFSLHYGTQPPTSCSILTVHAIVMRSQGYAVMTLQRMRTRPRILIATGSATQIPFALAIAPTENGNIAERCE
jgi:hypothetical protein